MTNSPISAMTKSSKPVRRKWARRPLMLASLTGFAVLAAACGSAQSASTTTTTSATSAASTGSVRLALATVPGVGSVLTGPSGKTLYYFTTDSSSSSTCTGQCAVVWPPLVEPAGATPALASGVSGTLGSVMRPDGTTQVSYMGHPLYYYQGDSAPGQDKGQGLDGTWFVVQPSNSSSPSTSPTTTTAAGGAGGVGF
jgi:predicted lipoprotein with Yx(FWY)xxD motif